MSPEWDSEVSSSRHDAERSIAPSARSSFLCIVHACIPAFASSITPVVFELLFTHPSWAYRTGTFAFASAWPLWLLAFALLVGAVVIGWSLARQRALGWRLLLPIGTLQMLFVTLLAVALWRPVLNVERVRDRENVLAVALDASASMLQPNAPEDLERSRLQAAVEAFNDEARDRLAQSFELRTFSFAEQVTSVPTLESVPPPGPQTRIGDALTNILQQAASLPLAGVILLSDGAENGNTLSEDQLAQIAAYGIPIHTVGVGPESMRGDLELDHVDAPRVAPQQTTVTAALRIKHEGIDQTRIRVYDRDTLIATREVELDANSGSTQLALELPSGAPGTHELRFVLDEAPEERNVTNNRRTHILEVPAERRHILYVEGEPRWEFKFLRRAATDDRALRLASLVRTTPNKHYRQGVRSAEELAEGFPTTPEALFAYDAIVIGSYEASTLTAEQQQLLKQFVDQRGGSVLMLAGRFGLAAGGWQHTAFAQTLPVRLPRESQFTQRTARAVLTSYGADSPITQLDPEPKRNLERWRALPALADYQTLGALKPGAVVLLDAANERGRTPLLAWQHYGRGTTYVLGTGSTLRWQMHLPPEDQSHETFWRQLLHALAARASPRVSVMSERTTYDDERAVAFSAEVRNARFEPVNDATVELNVAPEIGEPFTVSMQTSGQNDGRYRATIDAQTAGVYRASIVARRQSEELGSATTHVIRANGVAEQFAAHQHRAVLERLADMTGGRYWSLDELDGLAAAIPYSKAGVVERLSLDLWNLPIVFLTLLLLKLAEWGLRLKAGRV